MAENAGKLNISENSMRVLEKRYLKKDRNGKIVETPVEMFRRVAENIAKADQNYKRKPDPKKTEGEFFYPLDMISMYNTLNNKTIFHFFRYGPKEEKAEPFLTLPLK